MNRYQITPLLLCFYLLFFHFTLYAGGEEQKQVERNRETKVEKRKGLKPEIVLNISHWTEQPALIRIFLDSIPRTKSIIEDLKKEIKEKKEEQNINEEESKKSRLKSLFRRLPYSKARNRKKMIKKLEEELEGYEKYLNTAKSEVKKFEEMKDNTLYQRRMDQRLGLHAFLEKVKREKKIDNKESRKILDRIYRFTRLRKRGFYRENKTIPYYVHKHGEAKEAKGNKEDEKIREHNLKVLTESCLTHCSQAGLEQLDSSNFFQSVSDYKASESIFL